MFFENPLSRHIYEGRDCLANRSDRVQSSGELIFMFLWFFNGTKLNSYSVFCVRLYKYSTNWFYKIFSWPDDECFTVLMLVILENWFCVLKCESMMSCYVSVSKIYGVNVKGFLMMGRYCVSCEGNLMGKNLFFLFFFS